MRCKNSERQKDTIRTNNHLIAQSHNTTLNSLINKDFNGKLNNEPNVGYLLDNNTLTSSPGTTLQPNVASDDRPFFH